MQRNLKILCKMVSIWWGNWWPDLATCLVLVNLLWLLVIATFTAYNPIKWGWLCIWSMVITAAFWTVVFLPGVYRGAAQRFCNSWEASERGVADVETHRPEDELLRPVNGETVKPVSELDRRRLQWEHDKIVLDAMGIPNCGSPRGG
jgi:hypothetical protein